ncbi:MAG: hypothetical protein NTW95_02295 [Candidatus Aminicenantes bacterium]|nr:hypothetical protein [Candidatus Aminicenantes bacterium]
MHLFNQTILGIAILILLAALVAVKRLATGSIFDRLIMPWPRMAHHRTYPLGGSAPRRHDDLVSRGPFRLVRNPLYTGALGISFGLFCLTQSGALLAVFAIYLAIIFPLIALEEKGLQQAFGERFAAYAAQVKKLVPFVY